MENTNVTEQSTNEIMPMAASGETNFASLTEKTTPASGDMFLMEDSEDTKKINYDKLADAILNKLTSKTYSGLETTAKNFVAALNELNSKSNMIYGHERLNQSTDVIEYVKSLSDIGVHIFLTYSQNGSLPGEFTGSSLIIATVITPKSEIMLLCQQAGILYRARISNGDIVLEWTQV